MAGLHEGTLKIKSGDGGEDKVLNRSVSIAAIRRAQMAGGDPFKAKANTPGLEILDPELVSELYRAGLRLGGPALAATWRDLFAAAINGDPEAGPFPAFHPWFTRDQFEGWIAGTDPRQRFCVVHGDGGTGKSFCARILRERLDPSGADLLHLSPTQTSAMSWSDAISGALTAEDQAYRTTAAAVRYDDVEAVMTELRRRSVDRRRTRWVALDFGPPTSGRDLAGGGWFALISALLMNDWVRVVAIDLDEGERLALQDLVLRRPETADVKWKAFGLDHVSRGDLGDYAIDLARAKGSTQDPIAVRDAALKELPDLSVNTETKPLQTAAAALAAIAIEMDRK